MPVIKCRGITYFSQLDEKMFFASLHQIAAVKKVEGSGSALLLEVTSRPSDKSLRELTGLFFRYRVDMEPLAVFLNKKNQLWFFDPKRYWFKKVFRKQ